MDFLTFEIACVGITLGLLIGFRIRTELLFINSIKAEWKLTFDQINALYSGAPYLNSEKQSKLRSSLNHITVLQHCKERGRMMTPISFFPELRQCLTEGLLFPNVRLCYRAILFFLMANLFMICINQILF